MKYGSGLWGAINIHACTGENTQACTDANTHSEGSAVMAAWFSSTSRWIFSEINLDLQLSQT